MLSVKPGITGVAALAYADEESLLRGGDWEATYRFTILPAKLQLDYLPGRSTRTDVEREFRVGGQVEQHLAAEQERVRHDDAVAPGRQGRGIPSNLLSRHRR